MAVFAGAVNNREELFRNGVRKGTCAAVFHRDFVDGADGRDLGCGSREKHFVRNVEQLPWDHLLEDWNAKVLGDLDD